MPSVFLATALAFLVLVNDAFAQQANRVALVIGNSKYEGNGFLRNPANDADAMEAALKGLGFSVIKKKDVDLAGMEDAIVSFRRELSKGSVGLFFYAGHGLQVKGENFLVPVGANMREEFEVKRQCLQVATVLDAMAESESNLKILVLDCCRDNPFKRSWSRGTSGSGLAALSNVPEGTVIAFATSPDKTAADGTGKNSPYTENLVKVLNTRPASGLELTESFREASRAVKRQTGQVPWLNMEASLDQYYLRMGTGTELAGKGPSISTPAGAPLRPGQVPTPGTKSEEIKAISPDGTFEVMVAKDRQVIALDKSGLELWMRPFDRPIVRFAPSDSRATRSYGPTLIVMSGSGSEFEVSALNKSGEILWSRKLRVPAGTDGSEVSFEGDVLKLGPYRIDMTAGESR